MQFKISIFYWLIFGFALIAIRCGCNPENSINNQSIQNATLTDESPNEDWIKGKMENLNIDLLTTIQNFQNNQGSILHTHKHKLFQLVIEAYTAAQIKEHGQKISMGKFILESNKKQKLLQEAVLTNTDWEKQIDLIANQPMAHKASTDAAVVLTTNFGDKNLFFGYGSQLFAQDEVQIAEMPHLAMLKHNNKNILQSDAAAAWIFTDVPRYVDINTQGIYGHAFANIPFDQLAQNLSPKLTYRNPITKNHIISIAAPNVSGSAGQPYTIKEFSDLFFPAFCAYQAVYQAFPKNKANIKIETGNWGAGAFGNDLRVSAIAQLLAAAMSQVSLAIYPFSDSGYEDWQQGIALLKKAIAECKAAQSKLTPQNIFEKAQAIATKENKALKMRAGNGT